MSADTIKFFDLYLSTEGSVVCSQSPIPDKVSLPRNMTEHTSYDDQL